MGANSSSLEDIQLTAVKDNNIKSTNKNPPGVHSLPSLPTFLTRHPSVSRHRRKHWQRRTRLQSRGGGRGGKIGRLSSHKRPVGSPFSSSSKNLTHSNFRFIPCDSSPSRATTSSAFVLRLPNSDWQTHTSLERHGVDETVDKSHFLDKANSNSSEISEEKFSKEGGKSGSTPERNNCASLFFTRSFPSLSAVEIKQRAITSAGLSESSALAGCLRLRRSSSRIPRKPDDDDDHHYYFDGNNDDDRLHSHQTAPLNQLSLQSAASHASLEPIQATIASLAARHVILAASSDSQRTSYSTTIAESRLENSCSHNTSRFNSVDWLASGTTSRVATTPCSRRSSTVFNGRSPLFLSDDECSEPWTPPKDHLTSSPVLAEGCIGPASNSHLPSLKQYERLGELLRDTHRVANHDLHHNIKKGSHCSHNNNNNDPHHTNSYYRQHHEGHHEAVSQQQQLCLNRGQQRCCVSCCQPSGDCCAKRLDLQNEELQTQLSDIQQQLAALSLSIAQLSVQTAPIVVHKVVDQTTQTTKFEKSSESRGVEGGAFEEDSNRTAVKKQPTTDDDNHKLAMMTKNIEESTQAGSTAAPIGEGQGILSSSTNLLTSLRPHTTASTTTTQHPTRAFSENKEADDTCVDADEYDDVGTISPSSVPLIVEIGDNVATWDSSAFVGEGMSSPDNSSCSWNSLTRVQIPDPSRLSSSSNSAVKFGTSSTIPAEDYQSVLGSTHAMYRRLWQETAQLALTYSVLLYAIPMRKRDGEINLQWNSGVIVFHSDDGEGWRERKLLLIGQDEISGDRLFRAVLPKQITPEATQFFVKDLDSADRDHPCAKYGPREQRLALPGNYYKLSSSSGITSLRDGELADGDRVASSGITISLILPKTQQMQQWDRPVIRFLDERDGEWKDRDFCLVTEAALSVGAVSGGAESFKQLGGHDSEVFAVVTLLEARRMTFAIRQESYGDRWLKPFGQSGNFHIPFPGAYVVNHHGVLFDTKQCLTTTQDPQAPTKTAAAGGGAECGLCMHQPPRIIGVSAFGIGNIFLYAVQSSPPQMFEIGTPPHSQSRRTSCDSIPEI